MWLSFGSTWGAAAEAMKAPAFDYAKPETLEEAIGFLEQYGEDARLLAGGQSLLATLNMRLSAPTLLVDIMGLRSLSGISAAGPTVWIGSLTRHVEVERSPVVAASLPLIAQAMPYVAHPAIRNRGTFGGSIAFADPAAELPACAVALGARFEIANASGTRTVEARDFFRGLFETALQPGDVLLGAEFPILQSGYRSAFGELTRRRGDYALVGLAAHGRMEGGRASDLRLVFFGVSDRPFPALTAAAALEGSDLTAAPVQRAQDALDEDLDPQGDPMTPAAVRRHLARVLLERVVAKLRADQARGGRKW